MIFVDAGAFIALHSPDDDHHDEAVETWASLRGTRLATSAYVLTEAASFVGREIDRSAAVELLRRAYASRALKVLRSEREDEIAAVDELERFPDRSVGIVDCLSFVLMRRSGISKAFTFDYRHFTAAGFEIVQ